MESIGKQDREKSVAGCGGKGLQCRAEESMRCLFKSMPGSRVERSGAEWSGSSSSLREVDEKTESCRENLSSSVDELFG